MTLPGVNDNLRTFQKAILTRNCPIRPGFARCTSTRRRQPGARVPSVTQTACADLKLFNQEVLRVLLLDTRQRLITMIDVTKGGLNESLAYPRDIFRPVIVHSAYSFVLAHNHPSGDPSPSEADLRLTRRLNEAARILQIQMLDHVIIDETMNGRQGYFSFKEAGTIG
jgi:DNA repair protein RadC